MAQLSVFMKVFKFFHRSIIPLSVEERDLNMTKLLVINSSLNGKNSVSRKLTATFVEKYQAKHSDAEIIEVDVDELKLPHLDSEIFGSFFTAAEDRSPEQVAHIERSDALVGPFKDADAIVIGVPMYTFGIPSTLKAYIDQLARAGETFKYTENGPVGLLADKPVYVLTTRGGDYSENGYSELDFVLPYMKTVMAFFGINNVQLIQANGMAMGEEMAAKGVADAVEAIETAVAA